jgi:hypothetical protein
MIQLCQYYTNNSLPTQWRIQKFSKEGARQQRKSLILQIVFLALYSPPAVFSPRGGGCPGTQGTPLATPLSLYLHLQIIFILKNLINRIKILYIILNKKLNKIIFFNLI